MRINQLLLKLLAMKRVLITGANGFVGRALVATLRNHGHWLPVAGLRAGRADGFEGPVAIHGPVEAVRDWTPFVHDTDTVVHLANRAHVMSDDGPEALERYRAINVDPTRRVAKAAAAQGVRRFVFVSSIKVNGARTPSGESFVATDTPTPEDAYGQSKAEAEAALFAVARDTGMDVVIVRPPLIYGPGVKGNFARLLRWVGKGIPLPLGAIDNRRSLVGLDNLVHLLVTCLDHPAAANQVFLAGDGEDISTTELLKRVAAVMNRPARLIPVPPSVLRFGARLVGRDEMARRLLESLQIDVSHTREVLGWTPPMSLDEGLRRAVGGR